jgi:glycosyltransferase involved in cell wall biosynthesis
MSYPKISVIMPAFNAGSFIEQSIKSFLDQSWPNKELIIIDDGSSDQTHHIASAYAGPTVKIVTQPNKGQCSATNRGILEATGEYIHFLDADDYLHPDKLSNQMKLQLDVGSTGITFSRWVSHIVTGELIEDIHNPAYASLPPIEWVSNLFSSGSMLANSCYLIHRSLIEQAGGYDETLTLNNDIEYFTRVSLISKGLFFCKDAYTYYRRSFNTLSQQMSRSDLISELRAKIKASESLLARRIDNQTQQAVVKLMGDFAYKVFPYQPDLSHVALARLNEWGCGRVKNVGGPRFRVLSKLLGFVPALQVSRFLR